MKPDSRRVYVFIVAGLIAAAVVGVAVWRMSSPSANYSNAADQSATTSVSPTHTAAEETTTSSTDRSPSKQHSTHATSSTSSSGDAKHQQPHNNDPFLAPNAIVRPQAATQPTKVYRPENISPRGTSPQAIHHPRWSRYRRGQPASDSRLPEQPERLAVYGRTAEQPGRHHPADHHGPVRSAALT